MSTASWHAMLQHVHQMGSLAEPDITDRLLLQRFCDAQDELAFAALMHRYGRLVGSVCRQVLGHEQDVEDAFQATFLVFASKANTIRNSDAVASWLYGVAYRVAMRTKQTNRKRTSLDELELRDEERGPVVEAAFRELQSALHEEVSRLPKTHQAAFVLCCLDGRSKREAAEELGWKEGTVSGRLARARKRLQERLATRGFELSAVLGLLHVASGAEAGAVPATLCERTIVAALHYSSGKTVASTSITAKACTLAEEVMKAMTINKTKFVLVALATLSLIGSFVYGFEQQTPKAKNPPTKTGQVAATPTGKKPQNAEPKQGDVIRVEGTVLGPDGSPLVGASVRTWNGARRSESKTATRATTGPDGRFAFSMQANELTPGSKLLAIAKGTGPDWADLNPASSTQKIKLRLVKDDVPIEGRLLDLEGQPIAGVTIDVHRIGKMPDGKELGTWIDRNVALRKRGRYLNEDGLRLLWAEALDSPTVKTDAEGRFTLTGLGRDRVVRLFMHHDAIEHSRGWTITRKGPKRGWISRSFPVYAAQFEHLAPPCKPITGTVRDKKTGKPISGFVVSGGPSEHLRTTTDKNGRYRLLGIAKRQQGYYLTTGGGPGRPYFGVTKHDIADTPGLEPITFDFDLERGFEITGKVIDKSTGKPVRGSVRYNYPADNPYLKEYASLGGARMIVSNWGKIGPDGSYSVLGLPGPGVLMVLASDQGAYPILDTQRELRKLNVRSYPVAPVHSFVPIKVSKTDPTTLHHDLELEPVEPLTVSVVGPEGKPLSDAKVAGLTKHGPPETLKSATFQVGGVGPKTTHLLVFIHEKKKLGLVLDVRAGADKPIQAKLQPLGRFAGRLVDEEGKPLAEQTVLAYVSIPGNKYANVPSEAYRNMGFYGLVPSAWKEFTGRRATTDKDGRFLIEGILPETNYTLSVGKNVEANTPELQALSKTPYALKPGKKRELGELKYEELPSR